MICTHTYVTLKCDGCGHVFGQEYEYLPRAVDSLLAAAREYGWEKTTPDHWYCPRCVPDQAIH